VRFVERLGALEQTLGTDQFALVGGLAVLARIGPYRATDDVDTVVHEKAGWPALVMPSVPASDAPVPTIDVIPVGDVPAAALRQRDLPDDPLDRAFCVAHRWAFDTATPMSLKAEAPDRNTVAVECRVATVAALVSMKLVAVPRRPASQPEKAESDLSDLYSLLQLPARSGWCAALLAAPHGLAHWCAGELRRHFVDGASGTARSIRRAGHLTGVDEELVIRIGNRALGWLANPPPTGP
jgi:hypothetical protein